MKTAIVVYQDAAGEPVESLDGRTLLQAARLRQASSLAGRGCSGWVPSPTTRHGLLAQACGLPAPVADTLCLGPLEAWLLHPSPAQGDLVYHVNLLTIDEGLIRSSPVPGLQETHEFAGALNQAVDLSEARFAGIAPGALLVMLKGVGEDAPEFLPVHRILGQERLDVLPGGRDAARFRTLMDQAGQVLSRHPVNEIRVDLGEDPVNGIWLTGGGRWPDAAGEPDSAGSVVLISPSVLGRGVARMLGIPCRDLVKPDASGEGAWFQVPDLVATCRDHDTVVVQVTLDGAASPVERVRELDRIDQHLLSPLLEVLRAHRPYRIALVGGMADTNGPGGDGSARQPVVVAGDDLQADSVERWDEVACARGSLGQISLGTFVRNLRPAP